MTPAPDTPQTLLKGEYELGAAIGRGGMGTVYRGVQRSLDRPVAVKMLSEELASEDEFRARFEQEAKIVASLSHPNIVTVHDWFAHGHTYCIVMEFLEGETLQARIDRDGSVSERDALGIGAQVARALHYAHSKGVIHRDIKPDNIFVSPQGIVKVMDFGIARFRDSKLKTQTGISMGTPKFMSPEQVTGKNVDGQTDLYSLGVCLYAALAGRVPFEGDNAIAIATRHLYEPPEPPSRLNTAISSAAERAVLKALEKNKADRYRTGNEMAAGLEAASTGRGPLLLGDDSGMRAAFDGATQRMASHTPSPRVPASRTAPGREVETEDGEEGTYSVDGGDAKPNAPRTPVTPAGGFPMPMPEDEESTTKPRSPRSPTRPTPSLPDDFRTPSGRATTPSAGARAASRLWPALAGAALMGAAVVAYFSKLPLPGGGFDPGPGVQVPAPSALSAEERDYQAAAAESERLAAARDPAGALASWDAYSKKHGDRASAERAAKVKAAADRLTSALPMNDANREKLLKRRTDRYTTLIKDETSRPLALAYLRSAADDGSKFAKTLLPKSVDPAKVVSAVSDTTASRALRERAKAMKPADDAEWCAVLALLESSVCLAPEEADAWIALARADADRGLMDDARLALAEAGRAVEDEPTNLAARTAIDELKERLNSDPATTTTRTPADTATTP